MVAPTSNLIGKTIRASKFRTTYGGAILAVSRHGEDVAGKLCSIVLAQGDTLLTESSPDFIKRHNYQRFFSLLANIDSTSIPNTSQASTTLAILVPFILVVLQELLPISIAALALVCSLGLTGYISLKSAQKSLVSRLLAAIGSSLALGLAIQKTGLANMAAAGFISTACDNGYLNLILLYLAPAILTEAITNNVAIVIASPIAQALSVALDASLLPFLVVVMFAASLSFLTPFGYQTNPA